MAKPGPKTRPPNLQDFIRQKALHMKLPDDTDIKALLMLALYEVDPEELPGKSDRGKLRVEILKLIHEINMDNKPVASGESEIDRLLLEHLRKK